LSCQLISRANNDFYKLTSKKSNYALRVAKAKFREPRDYLYEAEYLIHLHEMDYSAPIPYKSLDGTFFFEVQAPEGDRTITLFSWLEGEVYTKNLDAAAAHEMGFSLATLHTSGAGFNPHYQRQVNTIKILEERMPFLTEMLKTNQRDRDFYSSAMYNVIKAYQLLLRSGLPKGPVHGDFQFANVMSLSLGGLAALDFDTCGFGFLSEDICTFLWRSDMEIQKKVINDSFFVGYNSVRVLSVEEMDAIKVFRVARDLVMSASYALLINRIGPVPGFDGDFSPFTLLAQKHLKDANFN
jgi:Ser/Thr protein kinase RdoA (MazF antagonist)